ncbi:sphX [Symbiodinium natans]|uniref:SphX protein n=1 Tax=Symbiodinium natans TaxID=878477 RepID=A0A812UBI4_9DINO|nr:sphX [Symbiodinium natans]
MSREWKSTEAVDTEALLLDDGYTWECAVSKVRVTQLHVGTDGLAVVVGKDSQAHDCLTRSEVGGLTLGMLHWIFTNWTDVQLMEHGLDLASVLPNNDHDGVKEWSDFSPSCAEVPINAYGPGPDSGTYSFFGEATLCEPCFNKDEGSLPEYFMWCPLDDLHAMKHARVNGTLEEFVATMRPPNCYMSSESDVELIEWLTADSGGIAYLGYAYYTSFQNELTIARVASDTKMGIKDTRDVKVMPSTYTIMDGSYSVYTRQLYMNVDNEAWDRVYPFLSYGFSTAGRALVSQVGYVPLNIALLAKMKIRIEERGNPEADYVSVAPATCPIGTELTSLPFINAFGNSKVNYTCTPCTVGMYKFLDTPTSCRACEPGRYAELPGQSRCLHCDPGYEVVNGTSCRACFPGLRKREAAAVACTTCPPGSFNNESAQAECVFCGPGRFAPAGSTRCFDCPLNEFAATPGSGQCTACPEGAVTFASGSTGCSQCRVGFYRKAEAQCEPCPGSTTTAYQGATTQAECVCAEGWYLPLNADIAGNGSCVSCGPGLDCVLGSDLQVYDRFRAGETMVPEDQLFPKLLPGHFATMDEPTSSDAVMSATARAGCLEHARLLAGKIR